MKIAFIGGGNMATALIGSLLTSGHNIDQIQVAEPSVDARERLEKQWPIKCFERATDAIKEMPRANADRRKTQPGSKV